jgi:hypothetical protein
MAMSILKKSFAVLILAFLNYASNASQLKGDISVEDLLRAICQTNATERSQAIDILAEASLATNKTPYQLELNKTRDEFFVRAQSRPYDDNNPTAKLWFSSIDVLIEQLKTDHREHAGAVLRQLCLKPWPSSYEFWAKRWPQSKAERIEGMNRKKPK